MPFYRHFGQVLCAVFKFSGQQYNFIYKNLTSFGCAYLPKPFIKPKSFHFINNRIVERVFAYLNHRRHYSNAAIQCLFFFVP
jgi:hypothetical protein